MNDLSVFVRSITDIAEADAGWPASDLLSSLGTAGAAVIVTYCFLSFLKDQEQRQKEIVVQFEEYHRESQQKFQEQLDRLADLQEASQHNFQEQISRITQSQNAILRESILAMKSIEKTTEGSSATIRDIYKTMDTLLFAVGVIDGMVRRSIAGRTKESAQRSVQDNHSITYVS